MKQPIQEEALKLIEASYADAVAWAFARLEERYPDMNERFRRICLEDLHHHVEYLHATLESGYTQAFRDYTLWVKDILERRSVPTEGLRLSYEYFLEYYEANLSPVALPAVRDVLRAGTEALERTGELEVLYGRHEPAPLMNLEPVLGALLSGSRQNVQSLLHACQSNHVVYDQFAVEIAQPAMYEIGRRWQRNEVSVAQEHLATALCQYALADYYGKTSPKAPNGRTALFACVEGNHHTLGIRILSDHFELNGWTAQYLGANVPTSHLLQHIDLWKPDIIGLSVSLPQHVRTARAIVPALKAELGQHAPHILMGGITPNQLDGLWRAIGADDWAPDARLALASVT